MDLDTCGEVCILPGGEEVNFYQVLPLYREEMEYKLEHDADALLERLQQSALWCVRIVRAVWKKRTEPPHFINPRKPV